MYDVEEDQNNTEVEEALEFLFDAFETGKTVNMSLLEQKFPDAILSLQNYKLIESDINDEIQLSKEGFIQSSEVIRHHRLAERLLYDLFQIEDPLLENKACIFEHLIKKEVEQRVCALLGHPKVCPHNKKIPPGKCCKKKLDVKKVIAPLIEMKEGEEGIIAYLNTLKENILEKLLAIGILPGETVEIIKTSPSFAVKIGMSQFAFDAEIASEIFVRLANE